MAHDPDGRKALQVPGTASTLPALRDRSKIEAAIALGRAAMARQQVSERVLPPPPPPPVPTPRVETVRVQAFCSTHGRPNIVIAERRGDALRFIGNERAADAGANGKAPALLSDKYKIDMNDWRCPHCGTGGYFWVCKCENFTGVVHCDGNRGGIYHCACGKREEKSFTIADRFEVSGKSGGMTSGNPSASQRSLVPSSRSHR